MPSQPVHIAIEFSENTGKAADRAQTVAKTAQVLSMPVAFRKYDWLRLKPVMNSAGDLRGIVVNARARTVFELAIKGQELAKNISVFATITSALLSVYEESVEIVNSSDDAGTKVAKLSVQVSSASMRVITGSLVVPETLLLAHAVSNGCRVASQLFPNQRDTLGNVKEFADGFSADVTTKILTFTDGKNLYNNLQTVVVPFVQRQLDPARQPGQQAARQRIYLN